MASHPTRLYECQIPAYQSHSAYNAKVTNSTPTSPPEVTPTDINAACQKKKEIVNNLPTKCSHCGMATGSIVELKDGSIMAYCKSSECGRSQVLYVAPSLTTPKYKQVCVFEEDQSKAVPSPNEDHGRIMKMHGIIPNEADCKNCSKQYKDHERDYDTNGWVQCGEEIIKLPSDWPTWDTKSKTWK
jgi:hypothetical protein